MLLCFFVVLTTSRQIFFLTSPSGKENGAAVQLLHGPMPQLLLLLPLVA
jgi:hypothetical protein